MTPLEQARAWLVRMRELALPGPVKVMNVCGGHERTLTMAGVRSLLPPGIELIPGPGCPVCVCPAEDVAAAMAIARHEPVTVLAFGDMLRVPVHVPRGEPRSLEEAKAAGADVRPVASPLEAVRIAASQPDRPTVFFAVGFETTMAPVAAMVMAGVPDNLSLLLSGRLTWPAVAMLMASGQPGFDGLVAPGHVATVMGPEEWGFLPEKHHVPVAVAGFLPHLLLEGIFAVLQQIAAGRAMLENCYPQVVRPGGNPTARGQLGAAFEIIDANWRGVGVIPASGYGMRDTALDARVRYAGRVAEAARVSGGMPPGCACAEVVLGRIYPNACALYGTACTPREPVGPCMVSDEGACRIWWAGGVK